MKIFSAIVLSAVMSISTAIANPLELVTLQYPPYEYKEEGAIKGIAVDIVREVFKRMDQPIEISLYPWSRSLRMVEKGSADGIFTVFKNQEREQFLDYSKEVLMPQVISFFVLADSQIVFDGDISKLHKYKFGIVHGLSYGVLFDAAVKHQTKGISTSSAYTGEVNIKHLLKQNVDIIVSNKYGALDIIKKMSVQKKIKELSPELQNVPSYIAFSKKKNLTSIRDKFDVIIAQMKKDGTYNRIVESRFK